MALQNRVTPFGEIVSYSARGLFMGNRAGRFHIAHGKLGNRRWQGKAWLICLLDFKDRHRQVMDTGYTELFFLDEATALAAGHRPCFECRRADANAFKAAWASGNRCEAAPLAPQMDAALHSVRCAVNGRRDLGFADASALPAGAMVAMDNTPWLVHGGYLWRWQTSGYDHKTVIDEQKVQVLTPPQILGALGAGYQPRLHPSIDALI